MSSPSPQPPSTQMGSAAPSGSSASTSSSRVSLSVCAPSIASPSHGPLSPPASAATVGLSLTGTPVVVRPRSPSATLPSALDPKCSHSSHNHSAPKEKDLTKGVTRLYYCPEMEPVAKLIRGICGERIQLQEIKWGRFPDGFPDLFIHAASEIKWYHVAFLASFHSPSVIFEQFAVISQLPKLLPKSFKLILPFYPTGTMERVQRYGEVATAATLARILSTIPSCSRGPAQICIFDIHALQNQFYFKDTVLVRLGTCVNLLLKQLVCLDDYKSNSLSVAFPDDGAHKRFHELFDAFHLPTVICQKVRDGDSRVVKVKEGDVKGRYVVIVDDLVQSGGTLIECARELKKNGAKFISAYVTHAIFPNHSWKKFTGDDSKIEKLFEKFWTTDSNPLVAQAIQGKAPFEILSCAPNIADILLDETA